MWLCAVLCLSIAATGHPQPRRIESPYRGGTTTDSVRRGAVCIPTGTFDKCDSLREVVPFVRPAYLREGDSVGLATLSSKIDSSRMDHYRAAVDTIRAWGLCVREGAHLYDRSGGWFAAPDSVRALELQRMLENPDLRAILFFRGGYGAVRTLDLLDFSVLRRHPKWLVGFSDLTAVHSALRVAGVESIHGTMPANFLTRPGQCDTSALWLREALFGHVAGYACGPHPFHRIGTARGRLAGGNLSVLSSLNGTPEDIDFSEPTILLIEDVGESIHHIDRMLQTLKRTGKLGRIAGLIVGGFSRIRGEEQWGASVYALLYDYACGLDIPVLFGFPAGHERLNAALYMGREVLLTVTEDGGTLRFL